MSHTWNMLGTSHHITTLDPTTKTWEQRATIPPEASHPGILREPAGDMWLFGSLILQIFGDRGEERYPYPPSDCQFCKIVNAIKREHNLIKPLDMKIPDSVWKFVLDKCLVREPSKRISAAEAKPYIKQFMEEAAELEERQTLTARTAAKDVEDAGGSTECPKTGIVDSAVVTLHAPAEKAVSEERQTPTAGTVAKDVEDKGPPTKRPEASVGESTILAPLVPVENAGSEESQTLTARTLAKDVEDAGRSTECSQTITGNSAVVIPGAKSSQKTWRRRLRRCIWRC
ncbi:hypothetical protein BD410DRAFT_282120 [Rickenella mellea]|uniref:Protein kinase domain-containing protein n=1 Tax=Rickenella mellea TaxID=50990 RepID=A0A4Y7Q4K9_9AGAM|nr:hypothetical protein BD410DRAFT_282120 [Rickenella mellea]